MAGLGDRDLRAVAVAVLDGQSRPIGALSVVLTSPQRPSVSAAAKILLTASQDMTRRMGGRIIAGVPGTAPHDDLALVADLVRQRVPEISLHESEFRNLERLGAIEEGNAGYGAVTLDRLEAAYRGQAPFARRPNHSWTAPGLPRGTDFLSNSFDAAS